MLFKHSALAASLLFSAAAFGESVDLSPLLSSSKNQGTTRNTCSAFAAVALLEFTLATQGEPGRDLSEEFQYAASREFARADRFLWGLYQNVDGMAGAVAVQAAVARGWVDEAAWPYSGAPSALAPERRPDWRVVYVPREELGSYLLRQRRPLVFNIDWYPSHVTADGSLRSPDPAEAKACAAREPGACYGHVILLTGYDSETRTFLFRNSWGPNWGTGGYGRVSETYLREHCEACKHLRGGLSRFTPEEREFLRQTSSGISLEP